MPGAVINVGEHNALPNKTRVLVLVPTFLNGMLNITLHVGERCMCVTEAVIDHYTTSTIISGKM